MTSLVYAPEVQIMISTSPTSKGKGRVIDVTEDVTTGSLTRIIGGTSSAEFVLLNQSRKYDGMFSPMDGVVIYLRRIRKMLKFSGYLDYSPAWAAEPGSVSLRASCTVKRLANFMWDPTSPAAAALLQPVVPNASQMEDGGVAELALRVLTQVAKWPTGTVHIGRVPSEWFDTVASVADRLIAEAETLAMSNVTGSGAYIAGSNPVTGGTSTVPGIGLGTGVLPSSRGKCSTFGGPNGGAYGNFALTGESGTHPKDNWYCAMRWPYVTENLKAISGVNVGDAKRWWANRKILVSNPKTGKAVVVRAGDWGPNINTGRVIDLSPSALSALSGVTDDVVNISFAPDGANLGPVSTSDASLGAVLSGTVGSSQGAGAGAVTSGWGASGDTANMVQAEAGGIKFTCHRLAKTNFEGFINDLITQFGYHPKTIGGFRASGGVGGAQNHGYGAAIDIDAPSPVNVYQPGTNPRYPTGAGGKYALPKPPGIVNLARKWGLGWGGEYQNSKDYMHFEVIGAPYSNVAAYKTNPGKPGSAVLIAKWQPPIKNPPGYTVTMRFGNAGGLWASGTHSGTDFACPSGTPIYPVGPGTIHNHGSGDPSYGNWVSVDHGNSIYTFYAHMVAPSSVPLGTSVNTSTSIGNVGMTGNATGPHVHVELRKGADTYTAATQSGGIEKYLLGGANRLAPPAGVNLTDTNYSDSSATAGGTGGSGVDLTDIGKRLFDVWQAENQIQVSSESATLGGYRALMNDTPVSDTIAEFMGAGMRHWCSAPNGDFIAWFPDYFGHYGQAGKMVITPLEVEQDSGPPTVGWSDQNLKTHQFVTTASNWGAGDADTAFQRESTAGIASVEFPELMMALFKISRAEAVSWGTTLLERYGARPDYQAMQTVMGPRAAFFFACHRFQENFSQQYQTSINLTFMPELYPGMLACFPDYGIQGYVIQTTDSWDLTGGGFSTRISAAPWSAIGGNPNTVVSGLPSGAPL